MLTAAEHPKSPASRIKGKVALVRSLSLLVIRVNRFGQYRARTAEDRVWAGRLFDQLTAALHDAQRRG